MVINMFVENVLYRLCLHLRFSRIHPRQVVVSCLLHGGGGVGRG